MAEDNIPTRALIARARKEGDWRRHDVNIRVDQAELLNDLADALEAAEVWRKLTVLDLERIKAAEPEWSFLHRIARNALERPMTLIRPEGAQ